MEELPRCSMMATVCVLRSPCWAWDQIMSIVLPVASWEMDPDDEDKTPERLSWFTREVVK